MNSLRPLLPRGIRIRFPKDSKISMKGVDVRGPCIVRVARERNRFASILRYAKAIPPKSCLIHPVTKEIVPSTRAICHTCGREFFHLPRGRKCEPNPNRKYCHRTCQASRAKVFDRWLERLVIEVLEMDYTSNMGNKIRFQSVSTNTVEKYLFQHYAKAFKHPPLHLTERIRQAARRLVGIPGLSGKKWRVVALEPSSEPEVDGVTKWIRRDVAPDRGNILLDLIEADQASELITPAAEPREGKSLGAGINPFRRKIDGQVLVDRLEWQGRYRLDDAGQVRPIKEKGGPIGDDLLENRPFRDHGLLENRFKKRGWERLLKQNKKVIDILMVERNKEFGL